MNGTHGILGLAILAWAAALFGARLGQPLLEPEEARYAEIARQMLKADRYLVPVRDGQDYLDKPPLFYWMLMASYRVLGVGETAARLPAIVAAWLTVAVVLAWGWRMAGPEAGLTAALTLTLFGDFVYRAPMVTMNGPLALFVAASLAAGHVAMLGGRGAGGWWLVSAAACGLGILMKGPVAAALVVPPLACWPWLDGRLRRPTLLAWGAWGTSCLAVAGPWFLAVAIERPEFVDYFFWKHHVERFAAPFDHSGPVWDYVPQIVLGCLPWSLAIPLAALSRRRVGGESPARSLAMVAAAAGLWGFVFFSLAGSKRPVYLIPIEPPLAVAAGAYLWHAREALSPRRRLAVFGGTAVVIACGVAFWLPRYGEEFSVRSVVTAIRPSLRADDAIFCYGHGWDSIGFYLERDGVRAFLGDERDAISGELARRSRAVVFVTTKQVGSDFRERVPAGMRVEEIGESRQTRVFLVRRESD